MKVCDFRKELIKTCHIRPGDVVYAYNEQGEEQGLFLVCSAGELTRTLGSMGLYKADKPVFLVDVRTGIAKDLPHLSAKRIKLAKEAYICLQDLED